MITIYGSLLDSEGNPVSNYTPIKIARLRYADEGTMTEYQGILTQRDIEYSVSLTNNQLGEDENSSNFADIVMTLLGITSNTSSQVNSAVGKTIGFFSEAENPESRLAFDLFVVSATTGSINYVNVFFGDYIHLCGFGMKMSRYSSVNWNSYRIYTMAGFTGTSFSELLEHTRQKVEPYIRAKQLYNSSCMKFRNMPLLIMNGNNRYFPCDDLAAGNNFGQFLYRVFNMQSIESWYFFLTGKPSYRVTYNIELQDPVFITSVKRSVKRIDLVAPVALNTVDEGHDKIYNNNENWKSTSFGFWTPGTNLRLLFSSYPSIISMKPGVFNCTSAGTSETVATLKAPNGEIWSGTSKNNKIQFDLSYGGKHIYYGWINEVGNLTASSFPDSGWKDSFNNSGFGYFLIMNPHYVTTPVNLWETLVPETSSNYASIHNAPFAMGGLIKVWNSNTVQPDPVVYATESYPATGTGNYSLPTMVANDFFSLATHVTGYAYPPSIDKNFWVNFINGFFDVTPTDFNPGGGSVGGGYSGVGGGDGDYDDSHDSIGNESKLYPEIGVGSLYKAYACTDQELQDLGTWLNSQTAGDFSGQNKLESFISLTQLVTWDGQIPTDPAGAELVMGGLETGIRPWKLSNRAQTLRIGQFELKEYYGSYLDYSPYTQVQLYLPFVGQVALDSSEVMNARLFLDCTQDFITNTITYELTIYKNYDPTHFSTRYMWSGSCSNPIPLSATDYSGKVSSILSGSISGGVAALGIGAMAAGFAPVGAAAIIGTAAAGVKAGVDFARGVKNQGSMNRTGSLAGTPGIWAVLYPFLSVTRVKRSLPETYANHFGFPSNISIKMDRLNGYTEVGEVHLSEMGAATDSEIEEIETLLKKGVIF